MKLNELFSPRETFMIFQSDKMTKNRVEVRIYLLNLKCDSGLYRTLYHQF